MFRSLPLLLTLFAVTPALAQSFKISGVRFSNSAYLEENELQGVAAGIVNRPIVFADLE